MASLFLGSPLILLFPLRRFSLVLLLVCSLFAAAALPWMSGWAQRAPPLYPLPRSGHSSVGLDLRTEKSGFFAIWTGLGLDLTSHVGLRILAFGMECQSIPSHQTLKQKNCQN